MTPAHTIARVKDAIDLAALVAEYVPLKKQSSRMVGCCPFHQEDTPSFGVHADGYWKCFGCQMGGDVFAFLQAIEGIPFHEALRRLADRAGISLDAKPISRQAQRWAQEEAACCRWYWARYRSRQLTAIHAAMDGEEAWLDALGAPLRWLDGLTVAERFAAFRARCTERDRAEFAAYKAERSIWAEHKALWMEYRREVSQRWIAYAKKNGFKDPDDFVRKYGGEAFRLMCIDNTQTVPKWLVEDEWMRMAA